MYYYSWGVRTRNNSKSKIFGLKLDPVSDLQLNDGSIYESEVYTVVTKFNPTLNLDTFLIALNDQLNIGTFGLSIGYLSIGEKRGVSVYKLTAKWIINIDEYKSTIDAMK